MIAPADTLATHAGMPFDAAGALDTAGTLFSSLPPAPGAGTDNLAAVADTLAATGEGWRAASAADLFGCLLYTSPSPRDS